MLPIGLLSGIEPEFVSRRPNLLAGISVASVRCFGLSLCCVFGIVCGIVPMVNERFATIVLNAIIPLGGESMSFMATWKGNDYGFPQPDVPRSPIECRTASH